MSTRVQEISIAGRLVGVSHPPYVIAEMSGNHNGDINRAFALIAAVKQAGADAIKLQTYTPDTMTIDHDGPGFIVDGGLWHGKSLYDLYHWAQTPWEWHAALFDRARELGLTIFSSAFSASAVDLLESLQTPAYKIASLEIVDLPLIRYAAATGKPMILSTGAATLGDIREAVVAARGAGCRDLSLLQCTSGYPTPASESNLRTIPDLAATFDIVVGLSDHTLGTAVPATAIAFGASIIEKHVTLARIDGGPDSAFSLEPDELARMVEDCRTAWEALGRVNYDLAPSEASARSLRRSLYAVADIPPGDMLSEQNVRSIRPGFGLAPKHLPDIIGRVARHAIPRGTPLAWGDIDIEAHATAGKAQPAVKAASRNRSGQDRPADENFLPYGRHLVDDDDVAAVARVLKGDWLTTGPTVEKFEAAFAARVGSRFAVACSSGTAALHLATLALRLGPGDRAVVPSTTFLATANAVSYVGADVIFADVDTETGLMNERSLETAIAGATDGVRAVLPVHLAGQTVDMAALSRTAATRKLAVIEDACHALGTTYRDGNETVTVGSCRHSVMAIFSFHPVKTIAMGEGGAVTTNDPALHERLMRLRNHGMTREPRDFRNKELANGTDGAVNPWYYEMPEIGFNYRASDIHCALALSQLGKLDGFIARRRELAECYDSRLAALAPWVLPPKRVPDCEPAWHLYPARFDFPAIGLSREELMRSLKGRGIGTQVHYIPVHLQPYYQDRLGSLQLPGSMAYYRSSLSLPLFPSMTEDDVARVVDAIAACLPGRRSRK